MEDLKMSQRTDELYRDGVMRLEAAGPARSLVALNPPRESPGLAVLRQPLVARSSPTVTLVLVGGPRLLRDSTASLLTAEDGLSVLGTFESAADFLSVGSLCQPSLLLLDCDGGDRDGFRSAVEALSSALPALRIVMLCQELGEELVRCAIEYRVSGVVLKSYSTKDIRAAIGYMATGRTIMPADWQRMAAPTREEQLGLSPRHCQVLSLIAQGWHNDEIAVELGISPNTIKFHIRAIYSRLKVRNRVEAAQRHAQMTGGAT
jgi:DNA-binding NarL/FixJ family response regulator